MRTGPTDIVVGELIEALQRIRESEGKVCADFSTCGHESCNSSYAAWSIADEVLCNFEIPLRKNPSCPDHELVQHRDGNLAWCNSCGKDIGGRLIGRPRSG